MNPAIAHTAVTRRQARHEDANSALELATLRRQELDQANARAHRAALNTIDLIDAVKEIHAEKTMSEVVADICIDKTRGPQPPANAPGSPALHFIDTQTVTTARTIALAMGVLLTFIAGVAVGRVL